MKSSAISHVRWFKVSNVLGTISVPILRVMTYLSPECSTLLFGLHFFYRHFSKQYVKTSFKKQCKSATYLKQRQVFKILKCVYYDFRNLYAYNQGSEMVQNILMSKLHCILDIFLHSQSLLIHAYSILKHMKSIMI
jgi:hypothetical protein